MKKSREGYLLVKKQEHPQADKNGYVLEHRLVYEDSRNCCIVPKLLGHRILVHHRDRNKANNVWYNLMLVIEYEHSRMHNPRYFDALCRCGSKNVHGRRRRDGNEHFKCSDCGEDWYIRISGLQIMLKERNVIKNPRIDIESLGLRCVCGSIDVVRKGTRNGKQRIDCNICHKSWHIPKLNTNNHRLSKRKYIVHSTQNKLHKKGAQVLFFSPNIP
jgi:transposase-like protein